MVPQISQLSPQQVIVYIDGFNFYYGAVKDTPYKWINLDAMCRLLLPNFQNIKIKYFTARIVPRPQDPHQSGRQETFLRALWTLPSIEIIFGSFLSHTRTKPLAASLPDKPQYVDVLITEEKGSDVNIATHLIHDAHLGRYDLAVLVSNDSDLAEPLRIARHELGFPIGLLNPHKKPSRELLQYSTFYKAIRKGVLAASQFPPVMKDAKGTFHKPGTW